MPQATLYVLRRQCMWQWSVGDNIEECYWSPREPTKCDWFIPMPATRFPLWRRSFNINCEFSYSLMSASSAATSTTYGVAQDEAELEKGK